MLCLKTSHIYEYTIVDGSFTSQNFRFRSYGILNLGYIEENDIKKMMKKIHRKKMVTI